MRGKVILAVIVLLAIVLRVYGYNWDQNQHLHPDERFLTMVATDAKVPQSFSDYLNPDVSTLNPYNLGFNFYVYGTFPVTLTKIIAVGYGMDNYEDIVLLGRILSAVADVGTLLMVFLLVRVWQKRYKLPQWTAHFSAFFYAIAVLPIQQAHFFTADTFATFFVFMALVASSQYVSKPSIRYILVAAMGMGLALGSKVSSFYIFPLIGAFFFLGIVMQKGKWSLIVIRVVEHLFAGFLVTYATLRLADPRIFDSASWLSIVPNATFLNNLHELKRLTNITAPYPPTLQWVGKTPLVFPLKNLALFGLGIPYFLLSMGGLVWGILSKKKEIILAAVWVIGFFLYQGSQNIMTMRYFYALYPLLAFFAALIVLEAVEGLPKGRKVMSIVVVCVIVSVWPLAFMGVYRQPQTRVQASEWIYDTVPEGSVLLIEHWDDSMPLNFPPDKKHPTVRLANTYKVRELKVYDPDSPRKKQEVEAKLKVADYYIVSSNRAYGSIMANPEKYPYMSRVYRDLFNESLGYKKVAEFSAEPQLKFGPWKFVIPDQSAEEAFTVYDHPKVMIF
ncbi:glycosyltransferase family 39 protein, partial [Candidatus Woesebacteria bacterium]|nr:glycosyltransferase family 39 protein [Candidatus Woesebacteria bacterium]